MGADSEHTPSSGTPAAVPVVDSETAAGLRRCRYPGCDRVLTADSTTGRPGSYCEQPSPGGGPAHNRATAWRARRAVPQPTSPGERAEQAVAAPVSLARAGLEQHLQQLPDRIEGLQQFLTALLADVRVAGDVEAAGAEVADAHRDALAKITAAEQQIADAERARRAAEQRVTEAEALRSEADAAAEAAVAETAQVREELTADLQQVRAQAEEAAAAAAEQLAAARTDAGQERAEAATARGELTALRAQSAAERQVLADLRADLDQARADARAEREALQRATDERVAALAEALATAREANIAYRAQLGLADSASG